MAPIKRHFKLALLEKFPVAKDTLALKFDTKGKRLDFMSGQYIGLWFGPLVKSFSIASTPDDPYLLLTMRIRPSIFKEKVVKTKIGTNLEFDGPYGQLTMPEKDRTLVMIAGGVGATLLRSLIKHAAEHQLPNKIIFLLSNKSPATAPFLAEFEKWAKENKNFTFVPTMTKASKKEWAGARGRINQKMIKKYTAKAKNPIFYLTGNPDMVYEMRKLLEKMKVSRDDIKGEEYAGY